MRHTIKTISVVMIFLFGTISATNAYADPIEIIIVTGSYNGPTMVNGMVWYDWANQQDNIHYTGNYYTDAATVAAAAQAAIDASNVPPPTSAEATRQCEQNIDADVTHCQSTYTHYNSGIGTVCAALLFRITLGTATYSTLCATQLYYLQQRSTQWCAAQGTTLKNNTCY